MSELIYLDSGSTTPVDKRVWEAMLPYFSQSYGNPSTLYALGREGRKAVEAARENIAAILGADNPQEIVFTSGASESNNYILKGMAVQSREKGKHIITSRTEHSSVMNTCKALEKLGYEITYLPVDKYGVVHPDSLEKAITPQTILVSIITANNEVGTIAPIKELAAIARNQNIPFHTDAVQAIGSMPIKVNELGVDAVSLSAHKNYGPKGVGILYLRQTLKPFSLIHGGGQENKKRAGTENVPGIVGMAKALELNEAERSERVAKMNFLREKLTDGILSSIPASYLTGHPEQRAAHVASFIFEYVEGESILLYLDKEGIAVSSGSACTSGSLEPSHVLLAMGIPAEKAHGSIRFTLHKDNTEAEIDRVLEVLPGIINRLREMSPITPENLKCVGK